MAINGAQSKIPRNGQFKPLSDALLDRVAQQALRFADVGQACDARRPSESRGTPAQCPADAGKAAAGWHAPRISHKVDRPLTHFTFPKIRKIMVLVQLSTDRTLVSASEITVKPCKILDSIAMTPARLQ